MKKMLLIMIPIIIMLVGLFILNNEKDLESFKGTDINDSDKITKIIKVQDIDYKSIIIDTLEDTYGLRITINKNIKYFEMEKYANELFYLVNDLSFVIFIYDDSNYNIDKDLEFKSLKEIDDYYSDDNFMKYDYLGTIKNYKVFDKSTVCINEKQLVGSSLEYNYYVYCSSLDNIYLTDGLTLKNALEDNLISIEDIEKLNIRLEKEEV